MGWLGEFRQFAVKGNVLDLAVGLIIGAEFGKIVNSMVQDVLMPPIGLLIGGIHFRNWFWTLKDGSAQPGPYGTLAEAQQAGAVTVNLGLFVTHVITFAIVAFAVFLIVRAFNRMKADHVKASS